MQIFEKCKKKKKNMINENIMLDVLPGSVLFFLFPFSCLLS